VSVSLRLYTVSARNNGSGVERSPTAKEYIVLSDEIVVFLHFTSLGLIELPSFLAGGTEEIVS
jgi:hypothetical protein